MFLENHISEFVYNRKIFQRSRLYCDLFGGIMILSTRRKI